MWYRLLLIGLHAAAGTACFAAGAWSLFQGSTRPWPYRLYLGCLVALVVFMVAAVGVDWPEVDRATRWIYGGLVLLGLYMLWRGVHAGLRLRRRASGWRRRYLDDIGFTLISLFDGFVIVAAIDLGAPV